MGSKHRVGIDFPTKKAAVEWFTEARRAGIFPVRAALVSQDALDITMAGVTSARTLLVKSEADHPNGVVVPALVLAGPASETEQEDDDL